MKDIIILLAMLAFTIYSFYLFFREYKNYKKEKDDLIKLFYELMIIVVIIPEVLYLLDRYNIPSKLNWTANINTSNWINFLGTYSAGILATIISAYFLIFMTLKQINRTYEDNQDLNRETSRIQNLPFLQYDITNIRSHKIKKLQEVILESKYKSDYDSLNFSLSLKNIGLNNIRRTYIEVESEIIKEKVNFELIGQSVIEKENTKVINFLISKVQTEITI